MNLDDALTLLDYKRAVSGMYQRVRSEPDHEAGWDMWCETRLELFASHPQSPIPERARRGYEGPTYFGYDPSYRASARLVEAEPRRYEIATSGNGSYGFTRFALAQFVVDEVPLELECYWLDGYGGGLFVPFKDGTSGTETYGAGRYLLDTVKGADLGMEDDLVVFDFNFSYNPSCAYDVKWVCPLPPPPNHLDVPIRAGERFAHD